jgi:cytidylate kinase
MNALSPASIEARMHSILGALRSEEQARYPHAGDQRPATPFVTISRQAGAGASGLAHRLVERLNELDPAERPWTCWDRELVERVSADHHIARETVDALEQSRLSWFNEFLSGLTFTTDAVHPDELTVYRRVAATIRALAAAGRVIIVGRGGVCITGNMPAGVHVRLVAPLKFRIQNMQRRLGISEQEAAEHVRQLDHNRDAFYRRYWPNHPLVPELFTLVLNAARLDEDRMMRCLLPLIVQPRLLQRARR